MSIKIYNSLTRQKDDFKALTDKVVSMYICGPTVYSDCHIGHIMGPILFDSVARWFKLSGYQVKFANNITDIDDKIINKSIETGEDWQAITKRYTKQYFDLLNSLSVNTITDFPRCSEYIPEMITYVQTLIDKGYAYLAHDGVYYSVKDKDDYGKLSGRKLEDSENSRITSHCSLKNAADFCLWKLAKKGEPSWQSPWGAGRPGWHLECSVMSNSLLGDTFDIHGGGDDLKFPHHENEIAQGEAFGGSYAQCWMHNGLIEYEGQKVGKSDPRMQDKNFALQFNAKHLVKTYGADIIRFFILRGQYRRPFDFAPRELEATKKAVDNIKSIFTEYQITSKINSLEEAQTLAKNCGYISSYEKFYQAMNNDFNTGLAIAEVFSLLQTIKKLINSSTEKKMVIQALTLCHGLLSLLGINLQNNKKSKKALADKVISNIKNEQLIEILGNSTTAQVLADLRINARKNKDWSLADAIRDELHAEGITVKDTANGYELSMEKEV